MNAYLGACARVVRDSAGGRILSPAHAERLLIDEGGVRGARIVDDHGPRDVRARATLLATGGFQGDAELRALLIHPRARAIPLRSNPTSRGDGLRLGLAAGGAFTANGSGFYGHLLPRGVAFDDPTTFAPLTLYYSEHSVLVNLDGRRFVDETVGDHLNALAVLDQREARALVIADQRVRDEWMLGSYVEGVTPIDKFDLSFKRGARSAVATTLDELLFLPEEWGYPAATVHATMLEFNAQCRSGALEVGRRHDPLPLDQPPYWVVEAQPGITFTYDGLRIDARARVLDAEGVPVAGLLAAGADAGGLYHRAYAGGLAAALVFGLQAARTALAASS